MSDKNYNSQKQKNVLITGCSSGVGHTLALEFNRRGYKVWATARKPESICELKEKGIQVEKLDVTSEEHIQEVVSKITNEDGGIDILVNNAGYGGMGPVVETPGEELERQFATNVFAPMSLVRAVASGMIAQRSGTIINIGSISGVLVTPFSGSYCASKAALNALSDALRLELRPFGVHVITVQPGAIRSRFAENASAALDRVWRKDSIYQPIESDVRKRANASQDNPTEAEDFCSALLDKLESGREQTVIRLGNGCRAFPFLKTFIPVRWLERGLTRYFGLNRLKGSTLSCIKERPIKG